MAPTGPIRTEARIGTSGWTYPDWKGVFYPEGLSRRKWLEHYAAVFDAVEVNATFYHIPNEKTARSWHDRTPDGFRFILKMSRLVTHVRRLEDCGRELEWFFSSIRPMEPKLGGILVQLPPLFMPSPGVLGSFLDRIPETLRYFLEFRNVVGAPDEILSLMRSRNIGFCINDCGGEMGPDVVTSDAIYLRFHGWRKRFAGSYPDGFLAGWAGRIRDWENSGIMIYAFFNNDIGGAAAENALRLRWLVRGVNPSGRNER